MQSTVIKHPLHQMTICEHIRQVTEIQLQTVWTGQMVSAYATHLLSNRLHEALSTDSMEWLSRGTLTPGHTALISSPTLRPQRTLKFPHLIGKRKNENEDLIAPKMSTTVLAHHTIHSDKFHMQYFQIFSTRSARFNQRNGMDAFLHI
jgi:hypothetical protein